MRRNSYNRGDPDLIDVRPRAIAHLYESATQTRCAINHSYALVRNSGLLKAVTVRQRRRHYHQATTDHLESMRVRFHRHRRFYCRARKFN